MVFKKGFEGFVFSFGLSLPSCCLLDLQQHDIGGTSERKI
jgi:hypothetical protein